MTPLLYASFALVLVFAVVALIREVRLRRALEKLLKKRLDYWRANDPKN